LVNATYESVTDKLFLDTSLLSETVFALPEMLVFHYLIALILHERNA